MLRIIGGSLKGRLIKAPQGARIRPTSSKVREAIFDILGARINNARFLDLYAGSGAVGIEALSRGASFSLFVENNFETGRLLKENIGHLDLSSRSQVLQMPAEKALKKMSGLALGFDLVFIDPPYKEDSWEKTLTLVFESCILEQGASVLLEHGTRAKPRVPPCFEEVKSYVYGDSSLLFVRKAESP